jgi:hypothetical protein
MYEKSWLDNFAASRAEVRVPQCQDSRVADLSLMLELRIVCHVCSLV